MNKKERGLAALAHREPDRVPLDFGGRHTTLHLFAHRALMRYLGLKGPDAPIRNLHSYVVEPDPQLLQRFERVTELYFPNPPSGFKVKVDPVSNTYLDEWGVRYYMPPDGYYFDLCESPLAGASSIADLRAYRWPNPTDPARLEGAVAKVRAAHEAGESLVVMAGALGGIWETAWYLLGFEQSYMRLGEAPEFMEELADRITDWQIAYWNMVLDQMGQYVDIVPIQDDLGGQNGPLMSPASFRRIYKPRIRRLVDAIKKKTNAQVYIHSCGSIYRLIPDLIECGIQILNPVQVNAQDMDSARLKREFGNDLTFWGGGCDPVLLQNGTVEQVQDDVKRRIDDLAPGGGFVFGSVHNIQANTPPQNIVAMYETALAYGQYS